MESFSLAAWISQDNLDIAAEFPKNLPASTARRRQVVGVRRDRDAPELARALGHGFEYGNPLSTHRQAIRRILDVTARVHMAVSVFERRANFEFGKRCVRILAHP